MERATIELDELITNQLTRNGSSASLARWIDCCWISIQIWPHNYNAKVNKNQVHTDGQHRKCN